MKILFILVIIFFSSLTQANCTIKMVFKYGDKFPLMHKSPDNSGIFKDLYTEAAQRIGCKLTITRLPKQRVHHGLKRGDFDFYPAASFSIERASYLAYIDNGLITGELGISSLKLPKITNLQQLRKHPHVIWLMEANSSKSELANLLGINIQKVNYLNLEKIKEFIDKRPQFNYFYIVDKEVLDSFLVKNSGKELSDFGLKVHKKCCGKLKPMYLGFSRFSEHMKEVNNSNYDATKKISADNQMVSQKEGSIAFEFAKALQDMKKEGVTDSIYHYWYPITH